MEVIFSELAERSSAQAAQCARACLEELRKHFQTRDESAIGILYPIALAAMTLVGRQRYGDMTVRALRSLIEIEGVNGRRAQVFESSVLDLEKTFLEADSEQSGLRRMARTPPSSRCSLTTSCRASWNEPRPRMSPCEWRHH